MSGLTCLLRHPEVATRSCSDCKTWIYDDKGEIQTTRGKQKMRRPANSKTPCRTCPKKSPEQAHEYELSDKNRKAVDLYFAVRGGAELRDDLKHDAILARNMGIIDRIMRQYEQEQAATSVVSPLLSYLLSASMGGTQKPAGGR